MPKYSSYPSSTTIVPGDKVLFHQASSNSEKLVDFDVLATGISGVVTVDTIAELKAINVASVVDGSSTNVLGYYAAGDGSGGVFIYNFGSVAADNGGTVIAPTAGAGRWLRVYTGAISVDWFGAVGNGTTNDTTAITSAITAAGANGLVLFSSGKTYRTISQITVPADGMVLQGYGATITSATEAQFRKFLFSSRTRGSVRGIRFNCLQSVALGGAAAGVIEIVNSSDINVRDCEFNDVVNEGVYILGSSTRCVVANNRFSRNFCAIFSDDNTVNQPTKLILSGNHIRAGLGTVSTSFSGGIKLSGVGTVNSVAGHVISDNVIDTAGDMGIELQTWVNDCEISGNVIYGTGFGISISGCSNINITGNNVRACAFFGIELASGSTRIAVSGGKVSGYDSAGALTAGVGVIVNTSTDVTVSGVNITGGSDSSLTIVDSATCTVTGCLIYGVGVNIKNSFIIIVSDNMIRAGTGANYFIFIDSTDTNVYDVTINGNYFNGTVVSGGIGFYHPANFIQDFLIANNHFNGVAPAWFLGDDTTAGLRRIRVGDNFGDGTQDRTRNIGLDVLNVSGSLTLGYNVKAVNVNATAAPVTVTLPSAASINGRRFHVAKSDAFNNVTVATTGGQTINGAATVVLTVLNQRVTVESDGTNWLTIQSN